MQTEIILLQSVRGLGQPGAVVKVAAGFFRNFLAPRQMAIRATKENTAALEAKKAELHAADLKRKQEAETMIGKFEGVKLELARQAGDDGRLYGAVSAQDVARALSDRLGIAIDHHSVILESKIKEVGVYNISVALHPEVSATVSVVVVRGEAA
jgi:large subunit ribosomal protein L9